MDDVNKLLDDAVKTGQISNIETLKKIVGKLSGVKASDTNGKLLSENDVNNWLSFFLPLVFNSDPVIKSEVIRGLELLLPKLRKTPYQSFDAWSGIRKEIIETYTKHIREMFDKNQPEWHRIFNILLNILDSVIAHNTVAINTFLPIIELAFRSDNFQSRADAFSCWKEVIKIFIKYNQISDPKRIKLICIPLKSSRSKTKEIAENKFDVWWTLIQALGDKLIEHTHLIESFIYFCVGPFGKQSDPLGSYLEDRNLHLASPGKIFDSVRDYSIAAIAYMLGKSPNRSVQRLAKQTKLTFNENPNIINEAIFDKIGNTLIAACIETTVLISKLDANNVEINDFIWSSLLTYITDKNAIKYRRFILDSLSLFKKLIAKMSKPYLEVLNQLIAGAITACVSHIPFVNDASSNEINEMVNLINVFIDDFKPKQISGMPASIKARIKFEPKKTGVNSPVVAGVKASNSATKAKKDKEEYVAIPNIWKFNPATLTEHQREKMKERREDIPSLYDGTSQSSQDVEVKPWNPKQIVIAGDQSHDTMVLNDNSNSVTPVITRLSKKESDEGEKKPTGPSPRKALTRSGNSPKPDPSPQKKFVTTPSPAKQSPAKESPKEAPENDVTGAARRKAPPKSLKQRKKKELQNLAIDTVEGKKLMEEIQNQPSEAVKRRTSMDRGAKRVEPTWKQTLIPGNKKTRKQTRLSIEEKEEKKGDDLKTNSSAKKILTQQNDNKVPKTGVRKMKDISEEESQANHDEDESVPNSQDPLKEQMERRRSRRESFAASTNKTDPEPKQSPIETKQDVTRAINFDAVSNNSPVRVLRNSPVTTSQVKILEKTPERAQIPTKTEQKTPTPIKTPEKLVATPTVRSSPRKPGSGTETQHAIVPLPIIPGVKSNSPTEASTANGSTDLELNELRRSPRKIDTDKPAVAQMSPMKLTVTVNDVLKQEVTPDRRKSPRKMSSEMRELPTPPLDDIKSGPIISEHGYAKNEKLKENNDVDEDSEETDYQIEEPSSDENDKEEESQTFLGEIVAPTSPTPNLDDELEPMDRSMTIPSSPDISVNNEKTSEFLNNTIDISPIATGKSSPITRLAAAKNAESPTMTTSPTERKFTRSATVQGIVNLDSPKTSNVMQGGRGAHMMSMVFKQNSSTPNQQPSSSRSFTMAAPKNVQQETRDILVFSKTLPAPDASPSASILKRKLDESIDEMESPANKRKRVSFHDPPVSITKEYIRHEEEIRSPSMRPPINRCLLMAAVAQQKLNSNSQNNAGSPGTSQFRYTLKRKSKRESTNDLRKLESLPLPQIPAPLTQNNNSTIEMSTLILNDHSTNQSSSSQMDVSSEKQDTSIRFSTKSEVLQYVMNTYQLEEILEMYFEEKKTLNPKAVRIMARELSSQMETDSKLRYSILDRLSEKHASEFLEHAIQENPSKAICERLTLPVILNFIMEKASTDAAAKLQILKKFETFIAGDEQTPSLLTKQELITFILNCLPEEVSPDETILILDEIFDDKSPAEIYDTLTTYFKKYLVLNV